MQAQIMARAWTEPRAPHPHPRAARLVPCDPVIQNLHSPVTSSSLSPFTWVSSLRKASGRLEDTVLCGRYHCPGLQMGCVLTKTQDHSFSPTTFSHLHLGWKLRLLGSVGGFLRFTLVFAFQGWWLWCALTTTTRIIKGSLLKSSNWLTFLDGYINNPEAPTFPTTTSQPSPSSLTWKLCL